MKTPFRQLFFGASFAVFFTLTLVALAQEPSVAPAAPVTPAAAPTVAPEKAVPPAATAATPAATTPAEPVPQVEPAKPVLRRLDTAPAAVEVEKTPVEKQDPVASDDVKPAKRPKRSPASHSGGGDDRVSVMGDTHVLSDEKIDGAAVGVMGDVLVDGEVLGDAVAVLGDNTINGTVNGSAVAVLGDINLGPKAKVGGDVVSVGGQVHREAGAQIGGHIVNKSAVGVPHFGPGMHTWWTNGLRLGRPLAIGPGLHWQWIFTVFMLVFYALLALVFPDGIRKCGEALVRRPVATIGASILSMLGLPVLFVLLLITIVGIPVALLFLPVGVVLGVMFGKASIYGLVGRAVSNDRLHPALAVLVGAVPFVLLLLVPVAGLMLWMLISLLGLGCVLTTLFASEKKPAPPTAPVPPMGVGAVPSWVQPAMAEVAPLAAAVPATGVSEAASTVKLPVLASASLPRAGFWIRLGALMIDLILVSAIFLPMGVGPGIFPLLACYGAVMWKLKGTTIGGIVCGLQVVRLDDRPLDWPTVVVRALGSFLSLIVAGLGFLWVVFDAEKQSWHDKIAGTTVVHATKRHSLV